MKHFPKISIIIRAFNEEKHIGRLLTGIQQQNLSEDAMEVILVDSGSADATVNIALHYGVKVIHIKPEDFSFGYALNMGCKEAKGKFLVFASAHVYPTYKDWLMQMTDPFEDGKVVLVYGKQRGHEVTQYSEHQIFKKWFPESSDFNQHHPFCNNANVAIRREIWEQIPYNESLTGLEDLDWAKKVLTLGYKLVYNAAAEIIHIHEETPKRILNRYRREAVALKNIMPDAKFTLLDFLKLFISNVVSDWMHALRDKVFLKNFMAIPIFRLMQFWGTYKGYRQKEPVDKILKKRFYYPNSLKKNAEENLRKEDAINYSEIPKKHIVY
jgi:rhamnosyltransferase